MTRLTVILLSVILMSSSVAAQDSIQRVQKLTPELKENFSKILKEKFISPSLLQEQNGEFKAIPLMISGDKPLNAQSLKSITHSKKPPTLPPAVQEKRKEFLDNRKVEKKSPTLQSQMTQLPQNIRYVGEFEESQAVLVAVPSRPFTYINNGYYQVLTNDFEYYYDDFIDEYAPGTPKKDEVKYAYYLECKPGEAIFWPFLYVDTDPNEIYIVEQKDVRWFSDFGLNNGDTTYRYIWANLTNAIQKEAEVWIRITAINDTTAMKNYMSQNGMPLTNYKFFYEPSGEDAFWARDWGPHGFYYYDNGTQKLGFHDAVYYTGRPFDDVFPRKVLDAKGYNWYDLQVKMEGGNMMTDGYGDASYGDVIYGHNTNTYGQYTYDEAEESWYIADFTPMNKTQLDARMKEAFNMNNPNLVKSLKYDGGTGHIDLWIKQFDEETMLIANMPDKYSGLTDYKLIQENRAYLSAKTTNFGTKYRFLNAPMPKRYDGPYPTNDGDMPVNNNQYNQDPRGYLNGLVVNKSYIYPSFSRGPSDPCWQNDLQAKEILKKLLPGYKLVPIDSRYLTPGGGAIHCITMQIPQAPEKLIRIKHKPIRDYVELAGGFEVSAELLSNTDANKVVLYWKKINDAEWKSVEMSKGSSNNIYSGTIEGDGTFVKEDTIRYFIAAQKDNEIRKCSPITGGKGAEDGYYEFYFDYVSIDELYGFEPTASVIASVYPNPVSDYMNIIFENAAAGNVTIEILNPLGQTIMIPVNKYFNKGVFIFDVTNLELATGIYFIKMTTNTGTSTANFVVK